MAEREAREVIAESAASQGGVFGLGGADHILAALAEAGIEVGRYEAVEGWWCHDDRMLGAEFNDRCEKCVPVYRRVVGATRGADVSGAAPSGGR